MGFFCRAAAGGQAGVVDAAELVAVEAFAADGLLDAADDGGGRLAAELLVEDRAGERIDRVERPAPARVRVDRADPLHPLAELAIAPGQVRECLLRVEAAPVSWHRAISAGRRRPRPATPRSAASRRTEIGRAHV